MRQIRFLCAVLAVSVLSLTGCADIKDLSEEQENEIAEYAAGVCFRILTNIRTGLLQKKKKRIRRRHPPKQHRPRHLRR